MIGFDKKTLLNLNIANERKFSAFKTQFQLLKNNISQKVMFRQRLEDYVYDSRCTINATNKRTESFRLSLAGKCYEIPRNFLSLKGKNLFATLFSNRFINYHLYDTNRADLMFDQSQIQPEECSESRYNERVYLDIEEEWIKPFFDYLRYGVSDSNQDISASSSTRNNIPIVLSSYPLHTQMGIKVVFDYFRLYSTGNRSSLLQPTEAKVNDQTIEQCSSSSSSSIDGVSSSGSSLSSPLSSPYPVSYFPLFEDITVSSLNIYGLSCSIASILDCSSSLQAVLTKLRERLPLFSSLYSSGNMKLKKLLSFDRKKLEKEQSSVDSAVGDLRYQRLLLLIKSKQNGIIIIITDTLQTRKAVNKPSQQSSSDNQSVSKQSKRQREKKKKQQQLIHQKDSTSSSSSTSMKSLSLSNSEFRKEKTECFMIFPYEPVGDSDIFHVFPSKENFSFNENQQSTNVFPLSFYREDDNVKSGTTFFSHSGGDYRIHYYASFISNDEIYENDDEWEMIEIYSIILQQLNSFPLRLTKSMSHDSYSSSLETVATSTAIVDSSESVVNFNCQVPKENGRVFDSLSQCSTNSSVERSSSSSSSSCSNPPPPPPSPPSPILQWSPNKAGKESVTPCLFSETILGSLSPSQQLLASASSVTNCKPCSAEANLSDKVMTENEIRKETTDLLSLFLELREILEKELTEFPLKLNDFLYETQIILSYFQHLWYSHPDLTLFSTPLSSSFSSVSSLTKDLISLLNREERELPSPELELFSKKLKDLCSSLKEKSSGRQVIAVNERKRKSATMKNGSDDAVDENEGRSNDRKRKALSSSSLLSNSFSSLPSSCNVIDETNSRVEGLDRSQLNSEDRSNSVDCSPLLTYEVEGEIFQILRSSVESIFPTNNLLLNKTNNLLSSSSFIPLPGIPKKPFQQFLSFIRLKRLASLLSPISSSFSSSLVTMNISDDTKPFISLLFHRLQLQEDDIPVLLHP
jgi:hypothetical protein